VDLWSLSADEPPTGSGLAARNLLPESVESRFGPIIPTHQNLNDGTLEGLRLPEVDAFSVQYHPEASPGPRESSVLFDEFVEMIVGN
jgi:carbamoyl-phosphate synthase small subunit